MIDQTEVPTPSRSSTGLDSGPSDLRPAERFSREGLIAGLLGAAAIAVWFLLVDIVRGRPLLTPSLLGTVLFGGLSGLGASGGTPGSLPADLSVSLEMVVLYTWVHCLVFCVVGGLAARLLAVAEREPHVGFGILILFVVFEFGFLFAAMLFAEPVLRVLTWPAILIGNLLAAFVMGVYLWRRHPRLRIPA